MDVIVGPFELCKGLCFKRNLLKTDPKPLKYDNFSILRTVIVPAVNINQILVIMDQVIALRVNEGES